MATETDDADRVEQLSTALAAVEERIQRACVASQRPRDGVTLITVTKFFPSSDVLVLQRLGIRDIGESRDQEASAKLDELDPTVRSELRVHFVGQLQSNKAGHVSGYADVVHSVDRAKVATALDRGGSSHGRLIEVLLQVDLSGDDAGRGGVAPQHLGRLADHVAASQQLTLKGVMTVAPRGADAAASFAELARLSADLRNNHPDATWISAGMSGDLEQAVANGATHLRVGSAILGSRPVQR
ncbi:MAG: YggS family pyridoxal phosphate-dependent enzyme [Allobranchiibius sp.]